MILEDVLQLLYIVFAAGNLAILQGTALSLQRQAPSDLPLKLLLRWKMLM